MRFVVLGVIVASLFACTSKEEELESYLVLLEETQLDLLGGLYKRFEREQPREVGEPELPRAEFKAYCVALGMKAPLDRARSDRAKRFLTWDNAGPPCQTIAKIEKKMPTVRAELDALRAR